MAAQCVIESSSILLVNDHPAWLEAARTILDSDEFIISSADSLDAALEMARALPPDLIVSDLAISGMSCAKICSRLKAEPSTADAPILLITSPSGDDQSLIEGMEAGAADCLHITASGVLIRKKAARLITQFKEKRAQESLCDITEHKLVEEELRRSEERFRLLIENSSEVISIIEADGAVCYQSPSIKHVLGYEPEDMIGKNLFAFVHPDDQQKATETLGLVRDSQGFASAIELRFIHKDGTERRLETIANNLLDDPVVAGIVINSRDITDRKNTEEALRLTQLSIDRNADAVYWIGEDGHFLYVNDSACRMVGYTRQEMFSMHLCDIDVIFIAENWPETWETTKRRETFTFESRQRNKRGKIFPVEVTASYLEFNGKECICAFVRDISERKIMERALRQSEREYRNLFENATDTMVVFDPETGIILEA
ncbi:MAG TPA: PAS domain S-box protein, partial [Blastocatellia bacterium]|nr:PAS domain S-box protein [Blastocatellia bacterium]